MIMRQLIFIALYLVIGLTVQSFVFKDEATSWTDAWLRYPGLWVLYFVIAHIVCERILRRSGSSAP